MTKKKSEIFENLLTGSVQDIWDVFKAALQQGISQFVPTKKLGAKKSLPWVMQEIKRLIRKRDSLYQKQK